jgi:hypothetical protein
VSVALQELRRKLPAGPSPRAITFDSLVEQLSEATNSTGLHEKLVSWGWVDPAGRALPWNFWQAKAPNYSEYRERGMK